jgi:biotin carboxylase
MMVLVGKRDGALASAARTGIDVVLVVERAPRRTPPAVRAVLEQPFSGGDWSDVSRRVRALGDVAGVLALTEAAVLPAAQLRAALGITGMRPAAAVRCTDKAAMKRAIAGAGLRCASFVHADEGLAGREIVERLGIPIFLKPARGSGGRGAQRLDAAAQVPDALPPGCMAESFVAGVEMSIESLVSDGRILFTNVTEYHEPRWENVLPLRLPDADDRELHDVNARALRALGVDRGITHLEAFRTPDGFVFGELAARPPGGHLMELIELAYGFDPWAACIDIERGRAPRIQRDPHRYAGVRVLHPGPGSVTRVHGLESIGRLPQLARLECRARPGDVIGERIGAGQEVGCAIFTGKTRQEVTAALNAARTIRFELAPA